MTLSFLLNSGVLSLIVCTGRKCRKERRKGRKRKRKEKEKRKEEKEKKINFKCLGESKYLGGILSGDTTKENKSYLKSRHLG